MTCGVECVEASSACVEALELSPRTQKLTLIFISGMASRGFREGFGWILEGFWDLRTAWLIFILLQRRFRKNHCFLEENCYFGAFEPSEKRCKIEVKSLSKKAWKHTFQNVDCRGSPGPLGLLKIQGNFKVLASGRPKNRKKSLKMLKK